MTAVDSSKLSLRSDHNRPMLDAKIAEAIMEATRAKDQPPELAEKLIRWMDDLVRDVETLDVRDAVDRRMELLYAAAVTERAGTGRWQELDSE
jgi:hypothetical protein